MQLWWRLGAGALLGFIVANVVDATYALWIALGVSLGYIAHVHGFPKGRSAPPTGS